MRCESRAICTSGDPVSVSCVRYSVMVSCLDMGHPSIGDSPATGRCRASRRRHRGRQLRRTEQGYGARRPLRSVRTNRLTTVDHSGQNGTRSPVRSGAVTSAVELVGVTRRFGAVEALAPIDLSIAPGEIVTVLGPSGSGKTTLLRLVGGLLEPTTGTVTVGGASPHEARQHKGIGFVPQSPALLPWR